MFIRLSPLSVKFLAHALYVTATLSQKEFFSTFPRTDSGAEVRQPRPVYRLQVVAVLADHLNHLVDVLPDAVIIVRPGSPRQRRPHGWGAGSRGPPPELLLLFGNIIKSFLGIGFFPIEKYRTGQNC